MRYQEFIERVQARTHLNSYEEAEKTTMAVLETLGERLYKTERTKLAAELPKELKEFVFRKQPKEAETSRENMDRFWLQEFYNRVGERADISHQEAIKRTKAVMSVIHEAVSAGMLKEAEEELPKEYQTLFK